MDLLLTLLQDQTSATGAFSNPGFFFFTAILVIFYFFLIRPQQKRAKEEKKFREGLQKGDKVITIGGIHGKINTIDDTSVLLQVSDNTKLRVDKTALRTAEEASK